MADVDALVIRWQAGDEHAAEALYHSHQGQSFRLAYGMLGDADDAEEVAQDALAYALMHIDRYDPQRAAFATWLHTIVVSRCRDRWRRRRLSQLPLAAWLKGGGDVADSAPHHEHRIVQGETQSEVWGAVQNLTPLLREAILLRYWAGHTYREMAEIMKCPVPTAQSRVRLAYQKLRDALAPESLADLSEERGAR